MEILELEPEETVAILRGDPSRSPSAAERHPGLHVSDIIRDIENTTTKVGKRPPVARLSPEELKRMGSYVEVGWMWERVIRNAMCATYYAVVARYESLGEIELDGIYGNPDWFDVIDFAVEELKATYRSSRRPIDADFWSWFVQVKAYCKMTETRLARLRVFFVNGDYRQSGPQFKLWRLEFEQAELDKNWDMLRKHGEKMQ